MMRRISKPGEAVVSTARFSLERIEQIAVRFVPEAAIERVARLGRLRREPIGIRARRVGA